MLTASKLRLLSDIARDIAQVLLAAVFLDPLVRGEWNLPKFIIGLTLPIIAWGFSLILMKDN